LVNSTIKVVRAGYSFIRLSTVDGVEMKMRMHTHTMLMII
jgi:hypothetical protein